MGIDPGTNYMGYGVLEVCGREVRSVVLGDIDLHRMNDPYEKLRYIFERVGALVDEYRPREVALESPFFGENVQSMLKLGRAQGVAMAAALSRGLQVFEYAPTRIKQCITGRGSAPKEQVAALVSSMLTIERPPRRLDATDGMAVALCHHFMSSNPLNGALGEDRFKGLGGGRKAASNTPKDESQTDQIIILILSQHYEKSVNRSSCRRHPRGMRRQYLHHHRQTGPGNHGLRIPDARQSRKSDHRIGSRRCGRYVQNQRHDRPAGPGHPYQPINDSLGMLQGQFLVAMQENDMEKFDSLNQVANGIMRRALDNNSDNLVGVYFFGNLYNEMEPQEAREILNKFPEQMQKTQILTAIAKSASPIWKSRCPTPWAKPFR